MNTDMEVYANMTLNEYQTEAGRTQLKEYDLPYFVLGLCGETGEVAEKVKKLLRGDKSMEATRPELLLELGDVMWYLARMSYKLGFSLEEVCFANLAKLAARKEQGKIQGDGDGR